MSEPIGTCPFCDAPMYAGAPRRGIWRVILPPRIERTCQCIDTILYSVQQSLLACTTVPPLMSVRMMQELSKDRP